MRDAVSTCAAMSAVGSGLQASIRCTLIFALYLYLVSSAVLNFMCEVRGSTALSPPSHIVYEKAAVWVNFAN